MLKTPSSFSARWRKSPIHYLYHTQEGSNKVGAAFGSEDAYIYLWIKKKQDMAVCMMEPFTMCHILLYING